MNRDGLLNVNKPPGLTSFRVVALVRRWSGVRRVGHAGTLDEAASGVLPVALGQATRLIEYLQAASKAYRAVIELGITTDTYDATGHIMSRADGSWVSLSQLQAALSTFRGQIWQRPPPYSAVRYQGRRLHELARAGLAVVPEPRTAEVFRLELLSWEPPLAEIEVECGKGTYIRAIAHDLGQLLGCGACLKHLVRTRYGPFRVEEAVSPSELEVALAQDSGRFWLYPPDEVLLDRGAVVVGEAREAALSKGQAISWEGHGAVPDGLYRVYNLEGDFRGLVRHQSLEGQWWPQKVFA